MDERIKRPSVGLRATAIVLGLLLLYPLSIGPVFWFGSRQMLPDRIKPALEWFYAPVMAVLNDPPEFVETPLMWYLSLWIPEPPVMSSPPPPKTSP